MATQRSDQVSAGQTGLIRSGRIGSMRVQEYRLWPGYVFPLHAHCFLGFVVGTDGRFTAEMTGISFHVERGQVLNLPRAELHCETAGALGATCILVEPDVPADLGPGVTWPRVARLRDPEALIAALRVGAFADPGPSRGTVAPETLRTRVTVQHTRGGRRMPGWLLNAWRNAQREPEAWTVRDLARCVGVTPETLCRGFVRFFGVSPSRCLLANRLERAAERLRATTQSLSTIAFDTGFSDQSHLTNRFARRFGMTPGTMRRAAECRDPVRFIQDRDQRLS